MVEEEEESEVTMEDSVVLEDSEEEGRVSMDQGSKREGLRKLEGVKASGVEKEKGDFTTEDSSMEVSMEEEEGESAEESNVVTLTNEEEKNSMVSIFSFSLKLATLNSQLSA